MLLKELDQYFRGYLAIDDMAGIDPSMNGVQVGRSDTAVEKVAFAVDACLETFERARETGAQTLVVHHGLFWGTEQALTGHHYTRVKYLMEHDMALYAVHLPLDQHPDVGNNIQMARALELEKVEAFGEFRGAAIGYRGKLPDALTLEEIVTKLFGSADNVIQSLPFGPERIRRIGIVSGGAPGSVHEAIRKGLDCFITGDASHTIYHAALEEGISVIFGGHYNTETWGIAALAGRLAEDTGLETTFIDVPTGL
ncbi:MAG: Nif3-like dinuclear metal center hexameric protein [Spirochaetaceae bacterium]